jgi:hypothetical protein
MHLINAKNPAREVKLLCLDRTCPVGTPLVVLFVFSLTWCSQVKRRGNQGRSEYTMCCRAQRPPAVAKTVPSDSNERNTFNFATFMLDADEPKRGIQVLVVQYSSLF